MTDTERWKECLDLIESVDVVSPREWCRSDGQLVAKGVWHAVRRWAAIRYEPDADDVRMLIGCCAEVGISVIYGEGWYWRIFGCGGRAETALAACHAGLRARFGGGQ